MEAVPELPVQRAAGETARPVAPVETISGSLAVTVPPGEPALVITLALALDGARDLAQAVGSVLELAQVLATVRDLDWVAVLASEMGRHRVVEVGLDLGRVVAPGWATDPGQGAEAGQDSEPARVAELAPAVELVRAQTPEQNRPEWAGGSLPRHY
jgi:hypothetical protein